MRVYRVSNWDRFLSYDRPSHGLLCMDKPLLVVTTEDLFTTIWCFRGTDSATGKAELAFIMKHRKLLQSS